MLLFGRIAVLLFPSSWTIQSRRIEPDIESSNIQSLCDNLRKFVRIVLQGFAFFKWSDQNEAAQFASARR